MYFISSISSLPTSATWFVALTIARQKDEILRNENENKRSDRTQNGDQDGIFLRGKARREESEDNDSEREQLLVFQIFF